MDSLPLLRDKIVRFLEASLEDAADINVTRLELVAGGSSRLTYILWFRYREGGKPRELHTIVRMIPVGGGFTSPDVGREARIFEALSGTAVPAPRLILWSEDDAWLGGPFLIVEQVEGCESSVAALQREPYRSVRDLIGQNLWTMLGELAMLDPVELGLIEPDAVPPMSDVWRLQMAFVDEQHRLGGRHNFPLYEMLLRWLRRDPPPPAARLSITHGDYRASNFLYDEAGNVPLIVDWELWRLGDPLSDLSYSIQQKFQDAEGRASRLVPVEDAVRAWEAVTGIKGSAKAMLWYEASHYAAALGMTMRARKEYFESGGREILTYFYSLASLTPMFERLKEILQLPDPTVARTDASGTTLGERIPEYLRFLAKRLADDCGESVDDAYLRQTLATDSLTLQIVAERFDNAAQIYVEDNSDIERLLTKFVQRHSSHPLSERIQRALCAKPRSVRVSELVAYNDRLCTVLVAAHAIVEEARDSEPDRTLDGEMRQFVSNQCERFTSSTNPFSKL